MEVGCSHFLPALNTKRKVSGLIVRKIEHPKILS